MIQRKRKFAAVFVSIVGVLTGSLVFAATELAKVNGKPVTDKDIQAALSGMNEGQRDSAMKDPNFRRHVLTSAIDQEILAQQAEKEALDKSPEYQEALNSFRKQYLSSKVL